MKSYTKSSAWDGKKRKHPVTSQTTGNTYEVVIHPYGGNDERYLEGCEVTLKQKRRFISREIISRFFDNDNGKITIAYWSTDEKKQTDFDYNLIGMANCIVQLYEVNYEREIKSVGQLEKDFAEFSKWDGIV